MNCPSCSTPVKDGAKFCGKCGAIIAPSAEASPASSQGNRCPTCGTENPPGAKFCKKDGAALGGAAAPTAPAPSAAPASPPPAPRVAPAAPRAPIARPAQAAPRPPQAAPAALRAGKSRAPLFIALAVFVVAALGGGGVFAYQKGWVGNRQGVVAAGLNQALEEAGLEGITVELDREWTATISGRVTTPERSEQAEQIVSESEDVADVENDVLVVADATTLAAAVLSKGDNSFMATVADERSLRIIEKDGANPEQAVTATIDESGALTLTGEMDRSPAVLFSGAPGVRSVVDKTTKSKAFRKREIDTYLQEGGLAGVSAMIAEDDAIVLSGGVPFSSERDRAQTLIASQQGAGAVIRNEIEIREATLSAPSLGTVPPPGAPRSQQQPAQPGAPRARLAGLWIGDARGTLLSYGVNLRLVDAGIGQVAGESIYAMNGQVICRGQVVVSQFDATTVVLQDSLTQVINATCQFGGTINLKLQNDGTYYGEWMSKNRAGKVAYKAVLRRR